MFSLINIILIFLAALPLLFLFNKRGKIENRIYYRKLIGSISILLITILFVILYNIFFYYYTDFLWFNNLGFQDRFWEILNTKIVLFIVGFLISFVFIYINLKTILYKKLNYLISSFFIVPSIFLGVWLGGYWNQYLLYINQSGTNIVDPIFRKTIGFYLFSLPFFNTIIGWIFILILITIGIIFLFFLVLIEPRTVINLYGNEEKKETLKRSSIKHVLFLLSIFFLNLAISSYLKIFQLLYSTKGVVTGAGFVDVYFRQLGYYVTFFIYFIIAVFLIIGSFSNKFFSKINNLIGNSRNTGSFLKRVLIIPVTISLILISFNWVIPEIVSLLVVKPNEISIEKPYIQNNINFTQLAYKISEKDIERKEIAVGKSIDQNIIDSNSITLNNIRLWDWRALMDNLKEQQEIRLYYEFNDVDIDRYRFDDSYQQMMLSVRELEKDQLDPRSKTWISEYLKYTHGYGLVILSAHDVLPQGKPNLLIKNIPPEEQGNFFKITRPEIYYGERTRDHVYVLTTEEEFDYPSGQKNAYTNYKGKGGVVINSFLKKLAFAWKYDGYRLFFSTYFTKKSRILFHRMIIERAEKVAPFLVFDNDPYAVLTKDGRIKYILDAYTISNKYPYSEKYLGSLPRYNGLNYIRNSVKVVIDAYDGTMNYYLMDKDDLIIDTYNKIFPAVFKSFDEMPQDIKDHIRYPSDFFTIQSEMYGVYHMNDPEVFYQREDVWQYPTERYRERFTSVLPYYVMLELEKQFGEEFVLMIPFTPKNKNVMNAWMAGRSDYPNYGKLLVFTFPKGIEVFGPRQIEARIDQDTEMSEAMTLWGQRGSQVIRGNLLVIPLMFHEKLYIIYVEPIFLQAEDAKLPELKKIAVADQEKIEWADSFEEALIKLIGGNEQVKTQAANEKIIIKNNNTDMLIKQAVDYFTKYQDELSKGNYTKAGEMLDGLKKVINDLSDQVK